MFDIIKYLSKEFDLKYWQVENTLKLKAEGATIPFIARYRKEKTGELDETHLRNLFDSFEYITELEERKKTIIKTIEQQGKLTEELRKRIQETFKKNELEDLYLPFKPKKRTRATIAKEKGLQAFADTIKLYNQLNYDDLDFEEEAKKFIFRDKGINTVQEAINGASDIIAEEISERAELRAWVRNYISKEGIFVSKIKEEYPAGTTKYEMYRDFATPINEIKAHNLLAMLRGEKDGILRLDVKYDEDYILQYLERFILLSDKFNMVNFYRNAIKDAFNRLMKSSIINEIKVTKRKFADEESIKVFEKNLKNLLLLPPAGNKRILAIDPGFKTGSKIAILDETGKFLTYDTIYLLDKENKNKYIEKLIKLIINFKIELIAIGNGTASRETDEFINEVFEKLPKNVDKPQKIIINESGASVYSASDIAKEEFPDLDVSIRGAISIGRRVQDPLAELVKIDPKSIGVGQYQHDVDQQLLNKKLKETVELCVNFVGVDLNTASKELLMYVSGINSTIAKNIIDWRNQNKFFQNRYQLLQVKNFGEKTFEQAAGFLRIRNGENILDNTAVHPERYSIVKKMLEDFNIPENRISDIPFKISQEDLKRYTDDNIGLPTLNDIMEELRKPGRDPREEFKYAEFIKGIKQISDLKIGMELEGVVTNVTNFGAFVDIGVHQDGLIHISELANRFVKHPSEIVSVGQIVKVKVIEINLNLNRISLSMKQIYHKIV